MLRPRGCPEGSHAAAQVCAYFTPFLRLLFVRRPRIFILRIPRVRHCLQNEGRFRRPARIPRHFLCFVSRGWDEYVKPRPDFKWDHCFVLHSKCAPSLPIENCVLNVIFFFFSFSSLLLLVLYFGIRIVVAARVFLLRLYDAAEWDGDIAVPTIAGEM